MEYRLCQIQWQNKLQYTQNSLLLRKATFFLQIVFLIYVFGNNVKYIQYRILIGSSHHLLSSCILLWQNVLGNLGLVCWEDWRNFA